MPHRPMHARRRAVAALALTLALAACAAPHDPTIEEIAQQANERLVATLEAEVRDPIRVQRAVAVAERIHLAEDFYFGRRRELEQRLFELNADYEARKPDFYQLFEEIHELRRASRDELLGLVDELKGHLTPDEWAAVWVRTQETEQAMEALYR